MSNGEMEGKYPSDAESFKFPPEGNEEAEAAEEASTDQEPTDEDLNVYAEMTRDEWEAHVAEGKQRTADLIAEGKRRNKEIQKKRYERKIKALEAIVPTGDAAADAQAWFRATEVDPNRVLFGDEAQAYKDGDQAGMLEYLRGVLVNIADHPRDDDETVRLYYAKRLDVLRNIIEVAESES